MTFKKIIILGFALLLAALWTVHSKLETYLSVPIIEKTQLFTVDPGSHFSRLGKSLAKQEIIDDLFYWKLAGKRYPELTKIKSGTYQFQQGSNLRDILLVMNKGIEHQFKLTLVEGGTFKEWLAILNNAQVLTPVEKNEQEILRQLGSTHNKLEGLLLPETYYYHASMDAFKIIEKSSEWGLKNLDKIEELQENLMNWITNIPSN